MLKAITYCVTDSSLHATLLRAARQGIAVLVAMRVSKAHEVRLDRGVLGSSRVLWWRRWGRGPKGEKTGANVKFYLHPSIFSFCIVEIQFTEIS